MQYLVKNTIDMKPALLGGNPVRKDFLVFGRPHICEVEINEVVDTLRSGWIGTGPRTHQFEEAFRKYIGSKYAIALNSCTAGLHLALDVLGINEGDEVITTPITFPSTANVIVHKRAKPVFVDVEKDTMNIDPGGIEEAITRKTKAIMPVHMTGKPCDMGKIMDIADSYNLFVIEDAAHAIEARYKGQKVGNIGDITAFSFYVTKNLVTGEGGMVATNNDQWAEEMRIKSLHGISRDAWNRYSSKGFRPYETMYPGYKYNMTDIQAALGIHQLTRIEENLKIRERIWHTYDEAFAYIPQIITPQPIGKDNRHARHLYTILLMIERLNISRNEFIAALKAENIGAGIHFTALHLHHYYKNNFGFKRGDFPNAEYISDRTVSLPLSPNLIDADIKDVIDAVTKIIIFYRKYNKHIKR